MKINTKITIKNSKIWIPSIFTASRLVMAFIFFYLFINNQVFLSTIIFAGAIATDTFDGYLARKLDATSRFGAFLDTIVDFILVLVSFLAFVLFDIYPFWILVVILLMFLQFIITSRLESPVYDPVGKYYGAFLFLVILLTLIFPNDELYLVLSGLVVIFSVTSIISRLYVFTRRK
jgi:CDP-diacylglycerol---glycerol-3-phosphate 3-phosphatidyltransferase